MGTEYRVRVRIITDARQPTLLVPRTALFRGPRGGWEVFVVRGGRGRRQAVEVGLMNDDLAELTAGVEAGESIVVAPENDVVDCVRIASDNF